MTVFSRAQEHNGLMREFSLIAGAESGRAVPRRLLDLADRLEQQYGVVDQIDGRPPLSWTSFIVADGT